jgi:acyl-CoA thioester hydrolase
MSKEQFTFSHRLRVRWAEVDMQSIVFNANYLLYFDVAITEYWRELGKTMPNLQDVFLIHTYVVKSTLDFHGSARFDEEIDICVRTTRLGSSSMKVGFEIHRDKPSDADGRVGNDSKAGTDHLISGESVYVFAPDSKSAPLPAEIRTLIERFEQTAPER